LNETAFAKKIDDALESVGALTFNIHGHRFQKGGWPDLYCAHPKWTGFCEFKVGDGKPTATQIIVMKGLLYRNVPAFVVRLRENVVYCELWTSTGFETLSYCHEWLRFKGTARGLSLLTMFDEAGANAIEIIRGAKR
jgi:hypothetical protein